MRLLKLLFCLTCIVVFGSCKHKKGDETGQEKVIDLNDWMDMFKAVKLPLNFGDSSLTRKSDDSALAWTTFRQFIPDTLIQKHFGKTARPRLFTSGKVVVKNDASYLVVKALGNTKRAIYLLCFDKEGKFKTGMPLVYRDEESEYRYSATIDNKLTITVNRQRRDGNGKLFYKRTVYVYNDEGVFTVILNESNEDKPKLSQIYNPIDTLSHKHKFTGDYIQDKRNFISFRDGKNSSYIRFFVHFEKDNGNCKGELRGEARFVSSTIARYIANGDPCKLEFSFSEKNVIMKEVEGCGSHRDIQCYFDGTFIKHKEEKTKPSKTKKR